MAPAWHPNNVTWTGTTTAVARVGIGIGSCHPSPCVLRDDVGEGQDGSPSSRSCGQPSTTSRPRCLERSIGAEGHSPGDRLELPSTCRSFFLFPSFLSGFCPFCPVSVLFPVLLFVSCDLGPSAYYWAGNEPDILAPWLFPFAGGQYHNYTTHWTRWLVDNAYDASAAGIPGNDDFGTLSAWCVICGQRW